MLQVEFLIPSDIRIDAVSPDAISMRLLSEFESAFGGERIRANVARAVRSGCPSQAAAVEHYLASEQSRWINGTDMLADGGISALAACGSFGFA